MVVHHVSVNMRVSECVNVYASHTHADTHTHVCIQHVGCECVCVCVPVYVNAKFVSCSASSVRHSSSKWVGILSGSLWEAKLATLDGSHQEYRQGPGPGRRRKYINVELVRTYTHRLYIARV